MDFTFDDEIDIVIVSQFGVYTKCGAGSFKPINSKKSSKNALIRLISFSVSSALFIQEFKNFFFYPITLKFS